MKIRGINYFGDHIHAHSIAGGGAEADEHAPTSNLNFDRVQSAETARRIETLAQHI